MSHVNSPMAVSCWNTIGVWGTQSPRCEKLQNVIHCRNCKVYWDAGREVFNRSIPDGYLDQWTTILAGIPQERSKNTLSIIYFRLGNEWFSLSTRNFIEVSQVKSVHKIPHQKRHFVNGLVNVNGTVRLCFSLSKLLGVTDINHGDQMKHGVYQRYLVVQINDKDYVFPVDEVGGVYRYASSDLKHIPATIEPEKAGLLLGVLLVDGNDVACISAEKLGQALEEVING